MITSNATAIPRWVVASGAIFLGSLILAGCSARDSDDLVGIWYPIKASGSDFPPALDLSAALVTFKSNQNWIAFDGCGQLSGTYSLGEDGSFQSSGNAVSDVGCVGGAIPYDVLFSQTDHVEFQDDGDALFEDAQGRQLLILASKD